MTQRRQWTLQRIEQRCSKDVRGCWVWTGAINRHGYGNAKVDRRNVGIHRMAWALAFGDVPDGLLVLHKCDMRSCVNPQHLFLGTHKDNTADMIKKNRHRHRKQV